MYEFLENQYLVEYEPRIVRFDDNYPIKVLSGWFGDIPVLFPCILNHFELLYYRFRAVLDFSENSADQLQISLIKSGLYV